MDMKAGNIYSFNTRSPAILGNRIERVLLKSELDASDARLFEPIDQKFAQVRPSLPQGSPTRPDDCRFYRFQAENGSTFSLADIWIDFDSVELVEFVDYTIVVPRATVGDRERIRVALAALGDLSFEITSNR